MHIIHSAARTAARSTWQRAPSHYAQRRHLFRLPDLTSFYPFADPAGVKPQTYHEHKVLLYVRAGNPLISSRTLTWVNSMSVRMFRYTRRQLYAVVSDVGSYASFVPFCTRSRV